MSARTHRSAFTLVELLVVLAIIAILTATAIPAMRQLGIIGRNAVDMGSRELLTMLKAARIYAGSHNVDTAVVYSIGKRDLPDTADPDDFVRVIDGAAIVRRLTEEDVRSLNLMPDDYKRFVGSEKGDMLPFVPVKGNDGVFKPFPPGAVIAVQDNAGAYYNIDNEASAPGGRNLALSPIRVLQQDLSPLRPRTAPPTAGYPRFAYADTDSPYDYFDGFNNSYVEDRFPAHVFKPSGILQVPRVPVPGAAEKTRFLVSVIPSPDSAQDERFYVDAGGVTRPVPAAQVQIYSATGRIESTS